MKINKLRGNQRINFNLTLRLADKYPTAHAFGPVRSQPLTCPITHPITFPTTPQYTCDAAGLRYRVGQRNHRPCRTSSNG